MPPWAMAVTTRLSLELHREAKDTARGTSVQLSFVVTTRGAADSASHCACLAEVRAKDTQKPEDTLRYSAERGRSETLSLFET